LATLTLSFFFSNEGLGCKCHWSGWSSCWAI